VADFAALVRPNMIAGVVPDADATTNELPGAVEGFTFNLSVGGDHDVTGEGNRSTPVVSTAGYVDDGLQLHWFELVHNFPTFFELGNILTIIVRDLEIYNAYRNEARTLTAFTNNADSGVTLQNFPTPPTVIQINNGLLFQVVISTTGPPSLDGTLDFTLDSGPISVPITGQRVVMFPFEPETPIREMLEFKTDVLTGLNGAEQRVSVRKHPRQIINLQIKTEHGHERRRLAALLSSWHPRVFGLPIWFEARPLGAEVAALDTTITVDTTYGDFRVGSLAIIWQDSEVFDALEIASLTSTTITFSSPVTNDYTSALVMPLRVANTDSRLGRVNWPVGLTQLTARFTVVDNESDIADTAAFNTHNSKVMLDDPNLMGGGTNDDNLLRQIDRLDNEVGNLLQYSDWDDSMPLTQKGFLGEGAQAVWEVRQLVHALRGSQVSFYMPTFFIDVVVSNDLSSGSDAMDIENIGYSTYLQGREPNKSLWIELTDGTILTRQVTGYTVIDSTTERLTVDAVWSSTITPAEIARVSFLRLCRIAGDQVMLEHDYVGDAKISMNVIGVIQ